MINGASEALRQHFFNHVAVDVGEAALDAVVVEGELFMVEAEEMKHGGVQVVNAHAI